MSWLNVFKHVLPHAKAWRLVIDKQLRQFFVGLSDAPDDVQDHQDQIWLDYRPQETTKLDEGDEQFALLGYGLNEQERRDRLEATWKALGGQSPRYIQDTLQGAGFNVFVHEWWEPSVEHPLGGSVDGDTTPILRNPFTYLDDGTGGAPFLMIDGTADAQDGDSVSQDGATASPVGYPLVNKILVAVDGSNSDGGVDMQDGGVTAQDNSTTQFVRKQFPIPTDQAFWPFFLYIGAQTFPDNATIPNSRREEFEDLCLKICPTEQWLGILVTYN